MSEKRGQVTTGDITVLIDGRGKNRASVLTVPNGVIRAASEKRNPKRRPTDNQANSFVMGSLRIGLIYQTAPLTAR